MAPHRPFTPIGLAAAISLALAAGLPGAAQAAPAPTPASEGLDWSLCRANAMLDFFEPGLPTDAVRETAPTDVDAQSVTIVEESKYRLEGDVVITRADQRVAADEMRYDATASRVEAEGDVHYQDKDLLLSADEATAEMAKDRVELDQVRYQLLTARGNGTAERAVRPDKTHTELTQVTFTTCDPDNVEWAIWGRDIELNHETGVGTARDMRIRFKDMTLLRIPYATFPIDDRRKSGFLYPQVGGGSDSGIDIAMPYYLNLAPNYDATLIPRILTDRGLMLGGEFRYLTERHRGEVGGTYLPDDREADRNRSSWYWDHYSQINRYFNFAADINEVSDDRYFEDFGDSLASAATSYLSSSAYVNGRGSWWATSLGADDLEVTDPRLSPFGEPYRRLPRFTFELWDAGSSADVDFADFGARGEFVRFDKPEGDAIEGTRVDVQPYVAFPYETAAFYVRPEIAVRHTSYDLDPDGLGTPFTSDRSPSRTTEIVSVDSGLFFDRYFSWGDGNYRQTLEPRAFYLYVPYEDQDDIPLFDTQELTFSFGQLFRTNRFSGADRQSDANQLTLAMSSRLIDDADGTEIIRGSIGQIFYFDDQDVQLPGAPPTDYSRSAWAGELDLNLDDRWGLTVSQQYDPNDHGTDLSAIRAQYRFGTRGVANLGYRFRRDVLEQLDASTAFPINDRLRFIARWLYSLRDEDTLEAFAGVEYESCCWAARVVGRHYVRTVEGESNNALYLELELKGLGAFGRKSEDFLRRAILGYR